MISYAASRQGNVHYKMLSMKLRQSVFLIVMTLHDVKKLTGMMKAKGIITYSSELGPGVRKKMRGTFFKEIVLCTSRKELK